MKLTGEIKDIIYKNDTNGYTIAVLYNEEFEDEVITVVGYLPFVSIGDYLEVEGKYTVHPEYGKQFKVDTFEVKMPQTANQLEKYLSNGIIEGIGPATAKKIIERFGDGTIEVLKYRPDKLSEIRGISLSKAEKMSQSFNDNWNLWEIVGYLGNLGIGPQSAQTIYKKLGQDTIKCIEENPYILDDIGINVDFAQMDKMALSLGIERNSLKRIDSGIVHGLNLATRNGHCCVLENNLIKYTVSLLGVSEEDILDGIKDLQSKQRIIKEEREDIITENDKTEMRIQEWIYLESFYRAEEEIVRKIRQLQKADNVKKFNNIEKQLKEISKIKLSEKQKEAIELVNENNVAIITGGPGTGKTTIIKEIIELYNSISKKVVLCAPTGRAAKRMTEATGQEAMTLHRLLEIGKLGDEKPSLDLSVAPLDADVLIIDEMSMVDLFLMHYVLKAMYRGTKLVMVGDSNQLPSVGPGSVLKDMIESKNVPTISLNKIFRQAAKSKIIVNAHKVNDGISFVGEIEEDKENLDDFEFITETNLKEAQDKILEIYDKDTQVISPTKQGKLGTVELNRIIQQSVNPTNNSKNEKKYGDIFFREGDRVMQTKNNYDIEWIRTDSKPLEYGSGIFNGEMGVINEIDTSEGTIAIEFEDGKMALYSYADLDQIVHSYAITVHKAQGSEFDRVVMPILQIPQMLLTRNILYTGMTRAKKYLTIISTQSTVDFMINNINTKKRNTGLKEKLK